MAKGTFDAAFALVIKHEGGYVDHPKDPGGATNLGVTIGTLSSWLGRPATRAEVKALTVETVKPIYRRNYWDAVRGDDLPAGLDYAVFDFAVNSGPARSAIYLQNIVGAAPDGKIGPNSIKAVNDYVSRFGAAQLINELCAQRLAFLERLSTWPTFGKGWGRRVVDVRTKAQEMASKPTPAKPVIHQPAAPDPDYGRSSDIPAGWLAGAIIFLLGLAAAGLFFVRF